jgi:hypothetical protein
MVSTETYAIALMVSFYVSLPLFNVVRGSLADTINTLGTSSLNGRPLQDPGPHHHEVKWYVKLL